MIARRAGFTLLEIMIVLLFIGLAASYVAFNAFGVSQVDQLEKEARRFQVVFDMASDFAILNQRELGIRVDKEENQYVFLYLDDEQEWQVLEDQAFFESYVLPEPFTLDLTLDDLPWQEDDSLFDRELFDEELSVSDADVRIGEDEPPPPEPPQIFILSSGDITPFSMIFKYEPEFSDDEPAYFRINGIDTPPLERQGPLDRL
ncbi:type II secretion system minor pseudopilin GspH [Aestuariibacter salexigens]|uniref:type II secretion system minor pseudopilin GspH n=1 Tax=Aestuariibacter salexigens TaxID=226010 RepID=UPI00040F9598|nr:type II secretion system minor pseudopilin GspH [Aestuariibacter salexigens]